MGGALALDAALTAPEMVAGLVLIGTAGSGSLEPDLETLDEATQDAVRVLIAAGSDVDAAASAHTRLWPTVRVCARGASFRPGSTARP